VRLVVAGAALALAAAAIYSGWYWVTEQGGRCDAGEREQRLLTVGWILVGLGAATVVVTIVATILRRQRFAAPLWVATFIALLYGSGTSIGCLS
jgi:tellurite resistance protein TehA-like permease